MEPSAATTARRARRRHRGPGRSRVPDAVAQRQFRYRQGRTGRLRRLLGSRGCDLDTLDPVLLDLSRGRAAQKARFGGEMFPNVAEAQSGLVFSEFFQNERDTGRKGMVVLSIGGST